MDRQEKMQQYPNWYWNALHVFDWSFEQNWDAESYLGLLVFWMPTINEYIDKTMVNGNPIAERIVKVFERLYRRWCRFDKLKDLEKGTVLYDLQKTYQRLAGLAKPVYPSKKKI